MLCGKCFSCSIFLSQHEHDNIMYALELNAISVMESRNLSKLKFSFSQRCLLLAFWEGICVLRGILFLNLLYCMNQLQPTPWSNF